MEPQFKIGDRVRFINTSTKDYIAPNLNPGYGVLGTVDRVTEYRGVEKLYVRWDVTIHGDWYWWCDAADVELAKV